MARIAKALAILREQINSKWPNRSKANDGWLGDSAHQARKSDHNPNARGVVQALDITHDPAHGPDAGNLAQALINSRDPRIKYVISNRRICASYATGGVAAWTWRPYHGANAHEKHVHISVADDPRKYDDASAWGAIAARTGHAPPQAAPLPTPQPASPANKPPEPIASWMPGYCSTKGQVFRSDPHEGGGAVKMGITFEALPPIRPRRCVVFPAPAERLSDSTTKAGHLPVGSNTRGLANWNEVAHRIHNGDHTHPPWVRDASPRSDRCRS